MADPVGSKEAPNEARAAAAVGAHRDHRRLVGQGAAGCAPARTETAGQRRPIYCPFFAPLAPTRRPSRFSHARSQAPGVRIPQALPPRRGPARAAPRGQIRPAIRFEGRGRGHTRAHLKRHRGSLDRSRPRGRHDGRARQPAGPAVLPPPGPPPARQRVGLRGRERPRQLLHRDRRPFGLVTRESERLASRGQFAPQPSVFSRAARVATPNDPLPTRLL